MVKLGMLIGARYEILEKIGTGGMSDVYKAKDQKLNRNVAVKVLKQEFSENENFVSKFRVEAQAAAGLEHANIVNVYDVGEEMDIHYIVMELVEGITLKKYIEKKARLTYKEAVSIAIQVGMGIEEAHNKHIIHRDIKPQNIIISKEGKVKVTDFGIAKAATSNTITSNVMGSVHYTSPEQARGGYSDEKSDIYSLGITLFEMLTGRVPFNGDTTVAIAIKHIQEAMPSPREYVPEIPECVESIVLKCCEKSPDRRYLNMHDLVVDLKQSLMNPTENFVVRNNPDAEAGTRMVTDSEVQEIRRTISSTGAIPPVEDYPEEEYYEEEPEEEGLRLATGPIETDGLRELPPEEDDPKTEKITTIIAIAAGVIIVVIIVILAIKLLGNKDTTGGTGNPAVVTTEKPGPIIPETTKPPAQDAAGETSAEGSVTSAPVETDGNVEMPTVVGSNVDDVRNALFGMGLKVDVEYEESASVTAGIVMMCDKEPGTELTMGTTVKLTVSSGLVGVEMPSVVGMAYDEAYNLLVQKGFSVNRTENYSDSVSEYYVISQTPDAEVMAPEGSTVSVCVSLGKEEVKVCVPNLVGSTESAAGTAAVASGLQIGVVTYVNSATEPEGNVCSQSIAYGSYVEQLTPIDIEVSLGADTTTYRFNESITAPTKTEAPDYEDGMAVKVKLETSSGKVLMETTVSSFPQSANYYGLDCATGKITMTYTVTSDGTTTKDPATGETVTVPGTSEDKSFTRDVTFVKE